MTQTDERSMVAAADKVAADAKKAADAAAVASKTAWVADVDITYSGLLALNLAPRTKTFAIVSAKVGDRVYAHRRAAPTITGIGVVAGIMLEATGFVPADGSVEIYHTIPAVGLAQTLTIPLRLVGQRPASV